MLIISYIHFFNAVVFGYLAVKVLAMNWQGKTNRIGALIFTCFFLWSFAFTFVHNPLTSREAAVKWIAVSSIGGIFYPVFIFRLASYLACRLRAFFIPFSLIAVVLTFSQIINESIVSLSASYPKPYGWDAEFLFNIWYIIYTIAFALMSILTLWLFFHITRDRTKPPIQRKQARAMLTGGIFALGLMNVFTISGNLLNLSDSLFNDAPFIIWAVTMGIAIKKYDLFAPTLQDASEHILETMDDAVFLAGPSGKIHFVNKAGLAMYNDRNLAKKHRKVNLLFRAKHNNGDNLFDGASAYTNKRAFLNTGKSVNREALVSRQPIYEKDGYLKGMVYVVREITEFSRIQKELERAGRHEALASFAGGVAHDLNNLFAGIIGYIEMAREHCEDNSKPGKYLKKACTAFPGLISLTRQLLTFSKGGYRSLTPCNISLTVRPVSELVLFGSEITLDCQLPADLWIAKIDEAQINQIISNLILNARQAMKDKGAISIEAHNSHREEDVENSIVAGDFIIMRIKDSGPGIGSADKDRIFDPLYTTKPEGSGLGLATTRAILKKAGGSIELESTGNNGTCFKIELPADSENSQEREPSADEVTIQKPKKKILLMDNDESVRQVTSDMFNSIGIEVLLAGSGEEALSHAEAFDREKEMLMGAVLDLTIRGNIDGVETARRLHQRYPGLPLVACSGYGLNESADSLTEKIFHSSIEKPYRYKDMMALVEKLSSSA